MSGAQDLILGARVASIRTLKAEIAELKAEIATLRDENVALKAHFDKALLAAADLRGLPGGAVMEIWDGWNLILGAQKEAANRSALIEEARCRLLEQPNLRIWIVLDGHDERVSESERLRVSYTGGIGTQRADRQIIDFVRMAAYLGLSSRVRVRTNDKDLKAKVVKLSAMV